VLTMKGDDLPYLLYAQFANRQRDGIFLARNGDMEDPLPTGHLHRIPYGCGALKINTVYLSLVEALLVPHVSDNQKSYETFPLRDLYLGGSVGVTGLLFEALYADLQTGRESGCVELNTAVGFRYNARGPRIPEREFKETRVVYVNAAYEEQIRMQRERRLERMQKDPREE